MPVMIRPSWLPAEAACAVVVAGVPSDVSDQPDVSDKSDQSESEEPHAPAIHDCDHAPD